MRLRGKRIVCYISILGLVYLVFCIAKSINYRITCVFTSPESLLGVHQDGERQSTSVACLVDLQTLGPVKLDVRNIPSFEEIRQNHPHVQTGGKWRPSGCTVHQKTAIVIPYRNRLEHLKHLLNRLHDMLKKQKIDYRIFLIEQTWRSEFNKGKLMNAGYLEALKHEHFDCFIFHDVDMLPENDRNLYICNQETRHLASALKKTNYRVWYCSLLGGAVAITRDQMKKINGFSNSYWGWGGEDDDFSARNQAAGITVSNSPEDIGRYTMIEHVKERKADRSTELFHSWRGRWMQDGLNDPVGLNYSVIEKTENLLYTNITVDVGPKPITQSKDTRMESIWWVWKFYHL